MYFWIFFAIFIIFNIVNLLTGFYLSKFLIKFIQALPLFILDIYRMDKTVFRGYGFWGFVGLGGSGKTLSIVDYLIIMREKYPKVKILTNFECSVDNGKILSWRDLLEIENKEIVEISESEYYKFKKWKRKNIWIEIIDGELFFFEEKNNGVIFGFDEIHLTFESTKWEDAPDNLLDYISQQRKLHKQIVASSQVFTRINKKLREQTNYVIECKSFLMGRLVVNKYYNTAEYIANDEKFDKGSRKRKTVKCEVFIAYDEIREKYNTEEIMKDLSIGKSETRKLSELIASYNGGKI